MKNEYLPEIIVGYLEVRYDNKGKLISARLKSIDNKEYELILIDKTKNMVSKFAGRMVEITGYVNINNGKSILISVDNYKPIISDK